MRLSRLTLIGALAVSTACAPAATPDLPECNVWLPACHYSVSSREATYDINRVVIHKTEGATAAGAASWFANCSSGGSAHYSIDKSNGYCYQSVLEKDIAWHAGYGSTNNNSVGIEHSGWVSSNDTSTACYDVSAIETRSCIRYYGVPCSRSYIIGHSEVPGCGTPGGGGTSCHTDPGRYWNWGYYMAKCGQSSAAYTRIHVFHRGMNDGIFENYWTGTAWSGGVVHGGTTYSAPAACPGIAGENIHIFHRGANNDIWERYWTGSSWTAWAMPFTAKTLSAPAACPGNGTNNIHVFFRGTDNQIWERYWTGSSWAAPYSLGGATDKGLAACAGNGTNNIHVFHRGLDGRIYEKYWTGSSWTGWAAPFSAQTADAPAVCTGNGSNNIHVFHRGLDNQIYENYWTGSSWSAAVCLGGTTYSAPTAVRAANTGNIHVFHRGADNRIYERYWTGSSWTAWACPFPSSATSDAPVACIGN